MADGHMLKVGPFVFSISSAAYQTLQRVDHYRWVGIERIGNELASQFMGPGERTITLTGVVYTLFDAGRAPVNPGAVVGIRQIDQIRGVADMATPLMVTDGMGMTYGRWVILNVKETKSGFFDHGAPRKQEFDLTMRFYGKGRSGGGVTGFGGFGGLLSTTALFSSALGLQGSAIGMAITASEGIKTSLREAGVIE